MLLLLQYRLLLEICLANNLYRRCLTGFYKYVSFLNINLKKQFFSYNHALIKLFWGIFLEYVSFLSNFSNVKS